MPVTRSYKSCAGEPSPPEADPRLPSSDSRKSRCSVSSPRAPNPSVLRAYRQTAHQSHGLIATSGQFTVHRSPVQVGHPPLGVFGDPERRMRVRRKGHRFHDARIHRLTHPGRRHRSLEPHPRSPIAATPDIDCMFVGPADLAAEMGRLSSPRGGCGNRTGRHAHPGCGCRHLRTGANPAPGRTRVHLSWRRRRYCQLCQSHPRSGERGRRRKDLIPVSSLQKYSRRRHRAIARFSAFCLIRRATRCSASHGVPLDPPRDLSTVPSPNFP